MLPTAPKSGSGATAAKFHGGWPGFPVADRLLVGRMAAESLWIGWPRRVAVISQTLAGLLRDGRWLSAVPLVGLLAPVAAAVVGFLVAVRQVHPLWSYSYAPAVVMAAAGALGAGIGLWACLGYIIGLFFFWHSSQGLPLSQTPLPDQSYHQLRAQGDGVFSAFIHSYLGVIVAVLVLIEIAILVPAIVMSCRSLLSRLLRKLSHGPR